MNKIVRALAVGAGLVLSVAAPNALADPIVQTLTPTAMSATRFNSLFTPITTVLTSTYGFINNPSAGVVESQVFAGKGPESGLYAYAYQFGVSNVNESSGNPPASVNSASMLFNVTPVGSDLTPPGTLAFGYVITSGQVGGLNLPHAAPGGSVVQTPSSIAWLPSQSSTGGSLTFQYLNPTTNAGPLAAGAVSGTIVLLSQDPFTQQYVSLQNPEPQTTYPMAYSPLSEPLIEVPVPEPATILVWTSVLTGLAVRHRFRRKHKPA